MAIRFAVIARDQVESITMLIRILASLAAVLITGALHAQSISPAKQEADNIGVKERAIVDRLKQPISIRLIAVPLRQAFKDIANQSGLQIVPDLVSLREARVNLDAPLSIAVEDIEMRAALNIILNPLKLRFIIENQALKITTQEKGRNFVRKWYSVGDLALPIPVLPKSILGNRAPGLSHEGLLIAVIENAVERHTWEAAGGRGTIRYCAIDKKLEVWQYQDVHEEVHELLLAIAKQQDLRFELEVKLLHASLETTTRVRKSMATEGSPAPVFRTPFERLPSEPIVFAKGAPPVVTLSAVRLAELIQAIKADNKSTVLSLPRATIFNGQTLPFNCVLKQSDSSTTGIGFPATPPFEEHATANKTSVGWRTDVKPIVSPDRKCVRLALNIEYFSHDKDNATDRSVKAAGTVMKVADRQTLLWYLGETVGASPSDRQHLFFTVTPQIRVDQAIVVTSENERVIPGR